MEILNNKKIWFSVLIIILILVLIKIFLFPSTKSQIKKILINDGFKLEDGIYIKETSELTQDEYYDNVENNINSYNETMYFDMNTYELKKVNMDYYNGMTIILNLNYSYEKELISFNYEANEANKGILFTGNYYVSGDALECELMNSSKNSISKVEKKTICDTIEKEVNHFFDESQNIFRKTNISDKLSKLYK